MIVHMKGTGDWFTRCHAKCKPLSYLAMVDDNGNPIAEVWEKVTCPKCLATMPKRVKAKMERIKHDE